jgi:Leucine-rich repeat (LRR) protein
MALREAFMKLRAPLQFRLWHLVVGMTICGVFLAWVGALRQTARRQAAALYVIQMEGGSYDDAADTPPWREWLAGGPVDQTLSVRLQRRRAGDSWGPYGPDGQTVKLHDWSAESFPRIGRALNDLPGVVYLDFYGTRLRNHMAAVIPRSPRLDYLSLGQTGVRSADLEVLMRVPNLTGLSLKRTSIGDDGLHYVSQLTHLEVLDLGSTDLTDAGMMEIARMKNLRTLRLENTQLTDKGLATLSGLRNLQELELGMTLVSPQSLECLKGMQISNPAAVESLQQSLPPTCNISASPYRLIDRPDAKAWRLGEANSSP